MVSFIEKHKQKPFLQLFTIYTRYLIGGAFVISVFGMGKLSGNAWNLDGNPPLDSAERFFQTIIHSGLYWHFIGWGQLLTGFLLMTQRFARLGAVMFLPLILNIFVITVSYRFHGTPIITGLMLLACIYLLLWDWRSLRYIVFDPKNDPFTTVPALKLADKSYWSYLGLALFGSIIVLPLLKVNPILAIPLCLAEGLLGFIVYLLLKKRLERTALQTS